MVTIYIVYLSRHTEAVTRATKEIEIPCSALLEWDSHFKCSLVSLTAAVQTDREQKEGMTTLETINGGL